MHVCYNPSAAIASALRSAAVGIDGLGADFDPQIRPSDPSFGDFQANGVLPRAKELRTNPRALAQQLIDALTASAALPGEWITWELAGPGFINFRLQPPYLSAWLKTYGDAAQHQQGAGSLYSGQTVVIDFSSPNTAKQMHVGHIRSSVIGESLARLLEFCGAKVIRDNHIGDWGTQFGILILAIKRAQYDPTADHTDPIEDFERLYKEGSALTKTDAAALEEARRELVKLQNGDPENVALWQAINNASQVAFDAIYKRLGICFDLTLGESFYRDQVDAVYAELEQAGIACQSEGALVVFHPGHERFATQPFIIRKSDGASNYASTDLATVRYRCEKLNADRIVYVTDGRQQDHFQQLFLTVEKWFAATGRTCPKLQHIWFGTILGEDGKAIKTRSGDPIRLKTLLNEAEERAFTLVSEKAPQLDEAERRSIAAIAGIGAVRYADLSQNRTSDYTFSWEKLLSFDGNTAPYLLYAGARIHSIFRKLELTPGEGLENASPLETQAELLLARKLVGFASALEQTLSDLRPHLLCAYLYELACEFSTFYNSDKVAVDDPAIRARRLMLCHRTLITLNTGLQLLGIQSLERM
jgi:arginyl-tRNA synthetase